MERLTSVNQNFELQFCSEVPCPFYGEPNGCNNPNYTCPSFCYFTSAAEKLAEYEETGITLDKIKLLQAENASLRARLEKAVELISLAVSDLNGVYGAESCDFCENCSFCDDHNQSYCDGINFKWQHQAKLKELKGGAE